jgi:hypothetical protein
VAQGVERGHQQRRRKHRVDRERHLRLDVGGDAFGVRPYRPGPFQHRPGVVDDRLAGLGQGRGASRAVEQDYAERRLHGLDRLADRRLDAAEPPGGGGKAADLGDDDQRAHLVKGQGVDH